MINLKALSINNLFIDNASIVTSKSIFTQIRETDAEFIVNLRNGVKGIFLRKGAKTIEDQISYLKHYHEKFTKREEIYYKVINRVNNQPEALVRITEMHKKTKFSWESLISIPNAAPSIPIDIMMTVYLIGFNYFQKKVCGPWDTPKEYESMHRLHSLVGMTKKVGEDDEYFKYQVSVEDFQSQYPKFKNFGFGLIEGVYW